MTNFKNKNIISMKFYLTSLLLLGLMVSSCKKNSNPNDQVDTIEPEEFIYFSSNGITDTISVCCLPTNYFNYRDSAATNSVPISTYIYGQGNNGNIAFGFSRVNIGTGSTQTLVYYGAGGPAGTGGYGYYPTSDGVKITSYGSLGNFVEGNFECNTVSPFTQNQYHVTCKFKVLRR